MKQFSFSSLRAMALTVLALGAFVVVGCGKSDQGLLAPEQSAVQPVGTSQISSGSFVIDFAPSLDRALSAPFAAKRTRVNEGEVVTESDAGWFSEKRGGKLKVNFNYRLKDDGVQVEKAKFEVEKGSIDESKRIKMRVTSGSSLGQIKVEFGPSGTVFSPAAKLTLDLKGKLTEEELAGLTAYHLEGDGEVSVVKLVVTETRDIIRLEIQVPGFSSYSMGGDDDFTPEGEGQ